MTNYQNAYLVDLFPRAQSTARSGSCARPCVLLAFDAKVPISDVILGNLDGVTLRVEGVKCHTTALEPLSQVARHLRRVRDVVVDKLTPDGCYGHEVGMW